MNDELRIPNMNNEIPHMNSDLRIRITKYHHECSVNNEEHVMTPLETTDPLNSILSNQFKCITR